jgi:DNA-binding PucR family transcriptional regulator
MVCDVDDFGAFLRERALTEEMIQGLKRDYLRRVSLVVRNAYARALLGARSDSVMALLPLAGESDLQGRLQRLGAEVQEAIESWKPGFTVSVGFSAGVESLDSVAGAYREVKAVLESLARFGRHGQVVTLAELGLTGLLAAVDDSRLADFVERNLGRIAEHDRARGGALLDTLKAYLEEGEQQAAARRLQVHPNTLRYRLDRIREISGADLDDPETRLNLAVALRVHGLLGL